MNREQCKGCDFFRGANGTKGLSEYQFCHYMLETGKRRVVGENEKCLSRTKLKKKK